MNITIEGIKVFNNIKLNLDEEKIFFEQNDYVIIRDALTY